MSYPKILREVEVLNLVDLSMHLSNTNRREKKKNQKKAISPLKKSKTSGNPKKSASAAGRAQRVIATQTRTNNTRAGLCLFSEIGCWLNEKATSFPFLSPLAHISVSIPIHVKIRP